ncbi:hypothetical protein TREMEDRAFT_30738 [Tremella mesenterica DSM 1558]|uniref:uncharacterized protein n=1 Tax=Tremella mesenterica (strain ATCC 24925 / CBS 8224 / DSM 1558 / NBRC 9311 / NRRL Y-6157 / RJB 2259-6 / UBC 559-6) TaxID=578456 RepID=UPI0003F498AB|nr:uncharacterized protein TREMEDRAFT_30738 [Tremella mesenterica DSM 1558]EIW69282.1 hypothetical protein TREMEDRAFT_30738 [Tremella mesenterica DSM 1558]
MSDILQITDLSLHLPNGLGPSAFSLSPPPPCPVLLSVTIHLRPHVIPLCAQDDDMASLGINYSSLSKALYKQACDPTITWTGPEAFLEAMRGVVSDIGGEAVDKVEMTVKMGKGLLHADYVEYGRMYVYGPRRGNEEKRWCFIHNLRVTCIVGLHAHERKETQRVEVDLRVEGYRLDGWSHKSLADEVYSYLLKSPFGTLESMIHHLSQYTLQLPLFASPPSSTTPTPAHTLQTLTAPPPSAYPPIINNPTLLLTIRKPSALPFAVPSITVRRTLADYPNSSQAISHGGSVGGNEERVIIAVGSNIGDRAKNIHLALRELEDQGVKIMGTSRLYESEPMYVEDQDRFVNGVVELSTSLPPLDLLRLLKRTETLIGRTPSYRNGPRVIDLDLISYSHMSCLIGTPGSPPDDDGVGWLEIPHPRLAEREFVLRPLADLIPSFTHPSLPSVSHMLSALMRKGKSSLSPIIPFWDARPSLHHEHPYLPPLPSTQPGSPHQPSRNKDTFDELSFHDDELKQVLVNPLRLDPQLGPIIMGIFNATPDSFSDGSSTHLHLPSAISTCESLLSPYPPSILDIGGMSTRPGSEPCTEIEEIDRVIPLIRSIRSHSNPILRTIPISIDTYRPIVAKMAVEAGANMINDVHGGKEEGMLEMMAELDVPVIIMHSRGDSKSMVLPEMKLYEKGVVEGVKEELRGRVKEALKKGVKRWNIILDPGLGFAKTYEDNLRILANLIDFTGIEEIDIRTYPWLIGASRKGFIGQAIGREIPNERDWGDAVWISHCVDQGVGLVRVHDVRGARETMKMRLAIGDSDK